ncbi:hypothetical protein [Haemophilus parainfluenzae]|jgi:hypothetical protein|uniref:hypothetical protein n=1 Tax=Haemophilus parainfluenzae TaxID=729 RepID=UPI00025B2759|nr:hypothetical protein [Haemophilus parainfluenzae]EIF40716.1 hypothetical protein HMPREF1118_2021 [Haemophilus parainfluenzae HK262]OBX72595.1 hypothetical protein A9296_10075 [Haemophilus parainfluenzae]
MYLKTISMIFILLLSINNCYPSESNNHNNLSLKVEISKLLKGTNWMYEDSDISYFDVDNDGNNEIITFAYFHNKENTYVKTLILKKRDNNQLYLYMENPMIQLPMNNNSNQYSEDYISMKDDVIEIHSIRGTALRTSLISYFKVINGELVLIRQDIDTYRNTDGESLSREYKFITGEYSEVAENILDQECRPNLTEIGVNGSICQGDNGYTAKKEIKSKRPNKNILFENLCSNFDGGVNFSFPCSENSHKIIGKSYLYKFPGTESRLYLVKGDLINIIDKFIDNKKQSWYFINYKGKKEINMWIKADSVDLN